MQCLLELQNRVLKRKKKCADVNFHSVKKVLKVKINIINLSIFIWNAYMQTRNVCSQKVFQ